jgi:hypothetical protein
MQRRFSKPLAFDGKYVNERGQICVSLHPKGNATQIIDTPWPTVRSVLRKICTFTSRSKKLIFNILSTEDHLNYTQDIPTYDMENTY